MTDSTAVSIAVVCEAPADQQTVCGIADRVLCAAVDWIEPEILASYRDYRGIEPGVAFLKWKDIPRLAKTRRIRPHGRFEGEPGAADARAGRRALRLIRAAGHAPQAILLIRDTDGDLQRIKGLNQARDDHKGDSVVVLATAHTKRECWVLAGFEPRDEPERHRLAEARKDLGFDPTTRADRLTAQKEQAKTSAKRILEYLTNSDAVREKTCWVETDLSVLEERGERTFLAGFLGELRARARPPV